MNYPINNEAESRARMADLGASPATITTILDRAASQMRLEIERGHDVVSLNVRVCRVRALNAHERTSDDHPVAGWRISTMSSRVELLQGPTAGGSGGPYGVAVIIVVGVETKNLVDPARGHSVEWLDA